MQKLELHYETILQGEFSLKKLNLLFVFQVNCPGCFTHGFPLISKLHGEFKDEISFLGLSTAFEDFALNSYEATKLLIDRKEMVGVTKAYFSNEGHRYYPNAIEFPVAMDKMADIDYDYEEAALIICRSNPNYVIWPKFEQDELKQRVIRYLENQEQIALTFTINQLRGTPSIILFNEGKDVLLNLFGHVRVEDLRSRLKSLLAETN